MLLEIDRNPSKLSSLINNESATNLLVHDLSLFVPFGINLDPYLRKLVRDANARLEHRHATATSGMHQVFSLPYFPSLQMPSSASAAGLGPASGIAAVAATGTTGGTLPDTQMQMQMPAAHQNQSHVNEHHHHQHQQHTLPAAGHSQQAHPVYPYATYSYVQPHSLLQQQIFESAGSSLNDPPHHLLNYNYLHQQQPFSTSAVSHLHQHPAPATRVLHEHEPGAAAASASSSTSALALLGDVCSAAEMERLSRDALTVPLRRWTLEQLRLVFVLVLKITGAELDALLQRCRADKLNGLVIHLAITTDISQLNQIFQLKFGDWLLLKSLLSVYSACLYQYNVQSIVRVLILYPYGHRVYSYCIYIRKCIRAHLIVFSSNVIHTVDSTCTVHRIRVYSILIVI